MANEKIPLVAVTSSLVAAAGYHPVKHILAIQFADSGTIKHYAGVSEELSDQFFASESKGRFLTKQVFNKFEVERMTGPCPNCGSEGWAGETCSDCGTAEHRVPVKPSEQLPAGQHDARD
jgi:hypothetical protein